MHASITGIRTPFLAFAPADQARSAPLLSPINQRRLKVFNANRRGVWSLWIFLVLFILTMFAEFIANDRPLVVSYKGELLFPVVVTYPESKFGGFLAETVYRDPFIADEINSNGWMAWPPIRYSYGTVDESLSGAAPSKPSWLQTAEERCSGYPAGVADPSCTIGNFHWLGTDDQGRDVLARLIYGFRISVLFGLVLTILSSIIGIGAGALQGYLGGWVDLIAQRAIEVWTSVPSLYLLLIISSIIAPSFWVLLGILLLFSWTALVGIVRAEFLRARNFEYVAAARALGVSNFKIMIGHLLPNAMVATLTFMPFILAGSVTTLTALDFLGFGLPVGSPSLGELLSQGKDNLSAWWLGITGFFTVSLILTLLVFIGEGVRDAFDPRKTFAGAR
ncbi:MULTISPECIES: ABC transporter permease [unclassified Devosia]|jgi:microcin C transport system permease protein|uniref:ABC transporter permease n=1 Tax=unclassified Devosia TaxID=196773 RepID=UPI000AC40A11|nr:MULTISPECIES: ABC transporter permease [unclassified Devosia]MBN9360407.1 ABC transporter permease [Devosia sp.]